MGNVYKDQLMDYDGKNYYKSTSGLWLEKNCKGRDNPYSEKRTKTNCKDGDNLSLEEKIKNFAKKVAKTVKKPTSTIKIPFEKEIQYEVEKEIEVEEGWFIFKSTRTETVMEQRTGTKVDYKDVSIDGWIIKTYYENVDSVVDAHRIEQEVSKWFYVLKKDGNLMVFHIGYTIRSPNTNWEKVDFFHNLSENIMGFDFKETDLPVGYFWCGALGPLGNASILDFKPVKWENSAKRGKYEILYFKRNFPIKIGYCESKGESYLVREAGTGLMEALKKLNKR